MGGCCCCASRSQEFNNPSPLYHHPRSSEVHQPLSAHHGTISAVSTGLLVDTNLDTSIPETYRAPPAPVPYETYVGNPRTLLGNGESRGGKNEAVPPVEKPIEETNSVSTQEAAVKVVKADENTNSDVELAAAKEVEDDVEKSVELDKLGEPIVTSIVEEDVCPTCLEEYDAENPKIVTQCEHHFHLACILEWMERSDTCPVCDKEMVFSTADDSCTRGTVGSLGRGMPEG